ncbi:MAG: leucine-rich repeat domain-containing protein [Clostridia bacterium]|nr:leucine-rich repeat domain-containing protein [Clostridia bacterium]
MKRKLAIIFLSICAVVCFAFGISACDGGSENSGTDSSSEESSSSSEETVVDDVIGYLFFDLNDDDTYSVGCRENLFYPENYILVYSDGVVTIPSTYNGKAVTIADYAFYGCTSVTSITIPDGILEIGDNAFRGCSSLKSITIGKDVTAIGDMAFDECASLEAVYISDLSAWCSIDFGNTAYANPLFYAGNLYVNGSLLTELNIDSDSGISEISAYAFYGCTSLESLTIEADVTINEYAFENSSLKSITIADDARPSIGYSVFRYCSSLESITFPYDCLLTNNDQTLEYIFGGTEASHMNQEYGYWYPASLQSVTITSGDIPASALRGCPMTSLTIGENVTSIGSVAFYSCYELTEINYNAKKISDFDTGQIFVGAGKNSNGVILNIGANVERVPAYLCFSENSHNSPCPNIVSVVFAENSICTSIGEHAFYYCASLSSVNIPDSITTICDYAFSSCTALTSLTIGSGVKTIGKGAFGCRALTEINFNATAMEDLSSDNGVFSYVGQSGDGITVNIGANVTKIPAYLFCPYSSSSYAPKIISVKFAENSECASIGDYAFAYCTALTTISNLPSAATYDVNIITGCTNFDKSSFYTVADNINYFGTQMINVVDTTAEIVIVKEGTTSIAENAFANCADLRVVYIPSSVTEIGSNALVCGADSDLKIYFGVSSSSSIFNNYTDWLGTYSYEYTYNGAETSADVYYSYATGVHLTDYYLHDSVTVYGYIGNETEISIPSKLGTYTMSRIGYSKTVAVVGDVSYVVPLSSFIGVTSITMPSSITQVNTYAFYNNTALTSVTLLTDSGDLLIYSGAFYGCTNLSSVTFTEGAQVVLQYLSFYGCASLTSLTLPSTTTSIIAQAFEESGLTSLTITNVGTAYLYTDATDVSTYKQYTLSDYTAEQLATLVKGDWLNYNILISVTNVTD